MAPFAAAVAAALCGGLAIVSAAPMYARLGVQPPFPLSGHPVIVPSGMWGVAAPAGFSQPNEETPSGAWVTEAGSYTQPFVGIPVAGSAEFDRQRQALSKLTNMAVRNEYERLALVRHQTVENINQMRYLEYFMLEGEHDIPYLRQCEINAYAATSRMNVGYHEQIPSEPASANVYGVPANQREIGSCGNNCAEDYGDRTLMHQRCVVENLVEALETTSPEGFPFTMQVAKSLMSDLDFSCMEDANVSENAINAYAQAVALQNPDVLAFEANAVSLIKRQAARKRLRDFLRIMTNEDSE